MKDFLEWLDDKNLVIFVIMAFGIYALYTEAPGALPLIEKLSYGILGMATGAALKK